MVPWYPTSGTTKCSTACEVHRRAGDSTQPTYLAHQFALSVYDAAYLSLAMERNLELASLDTALNSAARKARVKLSR